MAFSLNYRLADQSSQPWPDELTDVQRATRWVSANAEEYGVDNQKLVAMGLSAGGHLASLLGEIGTDGRRHRPHDRRPEPTGPGEGRGRPVAADRARRPGQRRRRRSRPTARDNKICTQFWRLPLVDQLHGVHPDGVPDSPTTRPRWWLGPAPRTRADLVRQQHQRDRRACPRPRPSTRRSTKAGVDHHFELLDGGGPRRRVPRPGCGTR